MKTFDIELSEIYKFLEPCVLQGFIHKSKKPSVLVIPGGAYQFVSDREAEPVAETFYEKGYNAFILTYSTIDRMPDIHYPMQLLQAVAAILYLRQNAKELNITEEVITCGFSAGGHLAAMTAVYYDRDVVIETFKINEEEAKPSAAILCYPVISSITTPHEGSFANLTGSNNPKEYINFSTELAVNKNTPPVFLWHTAEDTCVNVKNSIVFAERLAEYKVPFELHIFENGCHGLSVCDERTCNGSKDLVKPDVAVWIDLAVTWLNKKFLKIGK